MPLENIALEVLQAIYHQQQVEFSWNTLLWKVAERNQFWIGYDALPMPMALQINFGGLGGGTLDGPVPPHFYCTCPSVSESQVYGPSPSPADVAKKQMTEVAAGYTTGIHEAAALFSHIQDPCERWELLGFGKAAVLHRRTQIVLNAARLLPAHRRLPHKAFLSGLWWKLLSIQPMQLLATLPMLGHLQHAAQPSPGHFAINGFSAGSYAGGVIALAIRCLWPQSQITARLGAIAMPKGGPGRTSCYGGRESASLLIIILFMLELILFVTGSQVTRNCRYSSRISMSPTWMNQQDGWEAASASVGAGYTASCLGVVFDLLTLNLVIQQSSLAETAWQPQCVLLPGYALKRSW